MTSRRHCIVRLLFAASGVVLAPTFGQAETSPSAVQAGLSAVSPVMITPIVAGWAPNFAAIVAPALETDPMVQPVVAAPLPEPAAPRTLSGQGTYLVKKGAHLDTVARKTNTSLADLVALNPDLSPDTLLPAGTRVKLPIPGQY